MPPALASASRENLAARIHIWHDVGSVYELKGDFEAALGAFERGALAFQVHDPGDGDTARGTFAGPIPGAVRPLLAWTTVSIEHTRNQAVNE